jgi:hypothetical protein
MRSYPRREPRRRCTSFTAGVNATSLDGVGMLDTVGAFRFVVLQPCAFIAIAAIRAMDKALFLKQK